MFPIQYNTGIDGKTFSFFDIVFLPLKKKERKKKSEGDDNNAFLSSTIEHKLPIRTFVKIIACTSIHK